MKELTIRETQLRAYEILRFIANICTEKGWRFYLAWGTLIGAIRHDGFIPWDDDVDVFMPRSDYVQFLRYFENNNQSRFKLYSINNRNDYYFSLARVVDTNTLVKGERKDIKTQCDCGIFVDIYPLDFYGNSKKKAIQFFEGQQRLEWLKQLSLQDVFCVPRSAKALAIIKAPFYLYARTCGYKFFYNAMEKRANKAVGEQANYCCSCYGTGGMSAQMLTFPAEWFEKAIPHKFEDDCFPVPVGFDMLLHQVYGDYMKLPNEKERKGHHLYKAYDL